MNDVITLCELTLGTASGGVCVYIPREIPTELITSFNVVAYFAGVATLISYTYVFLWYLLRQIAGFVHNSVLMMGWGLAAGTGLAAAASILFMSTRFMSSDVDDKMTFQNWISGIYH